MRMKGLVWPLAACLLAGCVWFYRGPLGLTAGSPAADWPGMITLRNLLGAPREPRVTSTPIAAGHPRKCLVQGEVLYTNGECPAGSRREAIAGGTVSVLPAGPGAAPASAPQRPPHVRELLLKPDALNIKDKRMEEIIGQ